MRIIDSETHPIFPSGLEGAYPLDVAWRFPNVPGRRAESLPIIERSLAEQRFESVAEELLARMDHFGVERSVVMQGVMPAPNAILARLVAEHPDRFIGFACWDTHRPTGSPLAEPPTALAALESGLRTYRLRGVGELVLSRFHDRSPDQAYRGYLPTFELCRTYRCPVFFHGGYEGGPHPISFSNPVYLEPLAAAFPEVPLIVGHMGRQDTWFFEAALMLARKYPQVFLTVSLSKREFLERAVSEVGPERVLFGTDWSVLLGHLALQQGIDVHAHHLDLVRGSSLSAHDQTLVLGENLARLLGM